MDLPDRRAVPIGIKEVLRKGIEGRVAGQRWVTSLDPQLLHPIAILQQSVAQPLRLGVDTVPGFGRNRVPVRGRRRRL